MSLALSSLEVPRSQMLSPHSGGQRLLQSQGLPAAPCSPARSPVVLTPPQEASSLLLSVPKRRLSLHNHDLWRGVMVAQMAYTESS